MRDYKAAYEEWMRQLAEGSPLRADLESIRDDEKEQQERFCQDLHFGTAGLRGRLGAGTACMNIYTVGRAARGIAAYIRSSGPDMMKRGIVIAHDPRHMSREFSDLSAGIFARNGIRVYIFPDLRPTPELAFMVRHLHCACGVNVTASHNPKEYNGYKVYWEDGCQVGSKIAGEMTDQIEKLGYFDENLDGTAFQEGLESGTITVLGPEYDQAYLDLIEGCSLHGPEELDLSIPFVYTPLNGAGSVPFTRVMEHVGYQNWHMVPEQKDPDPDFTTVGYPNPESPAAFKRAEELGRQTGAQLLMATDPDADRFAVELLREDGSYVPLNGNQTGYLLVYYLLDGRKAAGTLPEKGAMVRSIVTSPMSDVIAASFGVKMFQSLTGFKNICGRIPVVEQQGYTYIFGYEESVGYAACPQIRDKDGISAGMLIAEAAAYYRRQGKSLWQLLMELYDRYGWYAEDEPNLVLEGLEGKARIGRMMKSLRADPPKSAAGIAVRQLTDYKEGFEDLEPTDALAFTLEDGSWFAVRPSGTEPKIKFYFYTKQDSRRQALDVNRRIREAVLARVEAVE